MNRTVIKTPTGFTILPEVKIEFKRLDEEKMRRLMFGTWDHVEPEPPYRPDQDPEVIKRTIKY